MLNELYLTDSLGPVCILPAVGDPIGTRCSACWLRIGGNEDFHTHTLPNLTRVLARTRFPFYPDTNVVKHSVA